MINIMDEAQEESQIGGRRVGSKHQAEEDSILVKDWLQCFEKITLSKVLEEMDKLVVRVCGKSIPGKAVSSAKTKWEGVWCSRNSRKPSA